jgi:hypothetical protein
MFTTQDAKFIDYDYYHHLQHLMIAGTGKNVTQLEQYMLDGIINLEECFMLTKLEKLKNA